MIKRILVLIFFLYGSFIVYAQDVIIKNNGEEIEVIVFEVGVSLIKYRKANNPDGPIYNIPKNEVFMIRYPNGEKDVFGTEKTPEIKRQEPVTTIVNDTIQQVKQYPRKGIHLGYNGSIFQDHYGYHNLRGWYYDSGLAVKMYFKKNGGLKTGLFYSIKKDTSDYWMSYDNRYLSVPIQYLLTTGNYFGFYLEAGWTVFYRLKVKGIDRINNFEHSSTEPVFKVLDEIAIGINFNPNQSINIHLGIYELGVINNLADSYISLPPASIFSSVVLFSLIGCQIGISYKLKNNKDEK